MTVQVLAFGPVLTDTPAATGTGSLDAQLLARAARDDYDEWLSIALRAGGCVRPIRLSGSAYDIDTSTGGPPGTAHRGPAGQGGLRAVRGAARIGLPAVRRDLRALAQIT